MEPQDHRLLPNGLARSGGAGGTAAGAGEARAGGAVGTFFLSERPWPPPEPPSRSSGKKRRRSALLWRSEGHEGLPTGGSGRRDDRSLDSGTLK